MSQRVLRKRVIFTSSDDEDVEWMSKQPETTNSTCSQSTRTTKTKTRKKPDSSLKMLETQSTQGSWTQKLYPSQSFASGCVNYTKSPGFLTQSGMQTQKETQDKGKNENYADQFRPVSITDLAINPTKVQELRKWLIESKKEAKRLLITGPAGAGKSTSVEIVCESVGIAVQDYESELLYELDGFNENIHYENSAKAFFTFLRNPRKTCGDDRPVVLLVDNLVIPHGWTIKEFQSELSFALRLCRFTVIFCLTDDSCNYWNSYKAVFTPSYLIENNVCSINFQPVASRFMDKALTRICRLLSIKTTASTLKDVASIANGDIRAALNIIQFSLSGNDSLRNLDGVHRGAFTTTVFHQIGSLLYAKREETDDSFENDSPADRPPLKRSANEIIEMTNMSTQMIMSFLQDHEPNFSPSIRATRLVFERFSFCDSMTNRWEFRNLSEEYSAQICARNVQYYNYGLKERKTGAYTFSKPKYGDVDKESKNNTKLLQECVHTVELGSEYFSLTIPMLPWTLANVDISQADIVSYLSRPLSFSRLVGFQQWKNLRSVQKQDRFSKGPNIKISLAEESTLKLPESTLDFNGCVPQVADSYKIEESEDEFSATNDLDDSFENDF